MKSVLTIPKTKYKLIIVDQLFKKSHKKYNRYLHENDITNRSAKRKLFYHYYIFDICQSIIDNNNTFTPVLAYNETSTHLEHDEKKLYKKFLSMFPVLNINIDTCSDTLEQNFNNYDIGEIDDLLSQIQHAYMKISKKRFYFYQIQKFCKNYELTFLDKDFFSNIKNKMSLV